MDTNTIRHRFLAFFEERDHQRVASSSLVPNDQTLLLTNAGMVQFKPYFLGEQSPPFKRAVTAQKCMRAGGKHNDIDQVGRTARHLTFFEMLGNFSFGDYYKSEACAWGWELVTEGYGLDPERLWVTVFETDDEAADIWRDEVGVPAHRIIRLGKKDNFWSMGVAGPCGPCSEISLDMGDAFGPPSDRGPGGNEDRYVELWNLVFMQNDCNAAIEPIAELPKKNIDTGFGLERVAMALQGVRNVFETDLLRAMLARAEAVVGTTYGRDDRADVALRVLADHGRSVTFMITDGILPSNEERGYVLRLIMRRAIRQARLLGQSRAVLPDLIEGTIELMGDAYPELRDRRQLALEVGAREEERFEATLKQGLTLLENEISNVKRSAATAVPGEVAFKLHDTFGFPIDMTVEIAAEAELDVDRDAFARLMEEQRERARAARRSDQAGVSLDAALAVAEEKGPVDFLGYEHLTCDGRIVAVLDGAAPSALLTEGQEGEVVLDRTVFYAEGGGQVGDRGEIVSAGGRAVVLDTQRLVPGLIVHRVKVVAGELHVGDEVEARVDSDRRRSTERAHTATHVLHWILRDRLGDHARQAGSLVEPGRLRFDFSHFEALSQDQLRDISTELQERVLFDDSVRAFETSYDFARSIGAMAIFGEKYGDFVRVVEVGDYSKELCGGTHIPHTSTIGVAVVTGEGSVGANLRRVEALVGRDGLDFLAQRVAVLDRAAAALRSTPDEVAERIERLLATHKEMERKVSEIERQSAESDAAALADAAVDVNGSRLIVARRDVAVDSLRALAQSLKGRIGSGVVVLGTSAGGKANLVAAVTKDLTEKGVSARDLLGAGASVLGGGGGGKPDLAISGGPNSERLDDAIDAVARTVKEALTS
ncbi:MAG: alanine--tRNA ligase [Actinomycetota bacterium]|nr:alanine--tRNA ligase [Actinomycetota bacterium]